MALVLFHTEKVRKALQAPASIGIDLFVLALGGGVIGAMFLMGTQAGSRFNEKVEISLSLWALPKYTLLTLTRGFVAYGLSLLFTLVYGSIAAHNHRAERIMLPVLDVLQSIPVLSFLPGLVLAMISLFPTREIGLEIACVIMIFTGQAWNMTFSYYGSVRSLPAPLKEAATVYRMGRWRQFKVVELPTAMIGLVWNSMMSMAGGWFVISVTEAFTLHDRDFRLPGIGSYMSVAMGQFDPQNTGTWKPIIAAVVAMVTMIVATDQLFWRPVVAWSERFKLEDTADADKPQSWVLNVLKQSRVYRLAHRIFGQLRQHRASRVGGAKGERSTAPSPAIAAPLSIISPEQLVETSGKKAIWLRQLLTWLILGSLAVGGIWGLFMLGKLLLALPIRDPVKHEDWLMVLAALGASFLRTTAAVVISGLWTLPAGILIGLSPKWSQRLQPLVQVVASFPAPMLFQIVTIALVVGLGMPFGIAAVALMLMGTQWYVLFNVIAGAMAIPGELKEVGEIYRTPWFQKWRRLYIPCVYPYFVTGLLTAAGGAWNATIVSEYVLVKEHTFEAFGLGAVISKASGSNFPLLAAATVSMALTVVAINRLVWKRLARAAETRYSLNVG